MAHITIEVPDSLAAQLAPVRDRLSEVLAHALQEQHPILNEIYRYVLKFLTSNPSPRGGRGARAPRKIKTAPPTDEYQIHAPRCHAAERQPVQPHARSSVSRAFPL